MIQFVFLSCLLCGGRHPLWVVQAIGKNWVLDSGSDLHGDSHQMIFTGARYSLVAHHPGLSADTLEDQAQPLVKETRSQSKRLERERKKKGKQTIGKKAKSRKITQPLVRIVKKTEPTRELIKQIKFQVTSIEQNTT